MKQVSAWTQAGTWAGIAGGLFTAMSVVFGGKIVNPPAQVGCIVIGLIVTAFGVGANLIKSYWHHLLCMKLAAIVPEKDAARSLIAVVAQNAGRVDSSDKPPTLT